MSGIVSAASLNPFSRGTALASSYEKSPYEPSDPVFRLTLPEKAICFMPALDGKVAIDLTNLSLDQLADIAEQLVAMIEEKQKSA